jgi:glycosyltransferase involved in cell wall biosynthesis
VSQERLFVIIPCFNEEGNLANTVDDVLSVAPSLPVEVEVLLIDDGSTDGTRATMEQICSEHENVRMRVNERNLGIGVSVMRAYELIPPGSWVTGLPGDNEIVFASIREFLRMREDFDLILGYLQNPVIRTVRRRVVSWAFTRIVGLLYGFPFRYYNGLKLYRVEVFRGVQCVSTGHAYMAEVIAKAVLRWPLMRIGEAKFAARGRSSGRSKAIRPASILRALREAFLGWRSVAQMRRRLLSGEEDMFLHRSTDEIPRQS